MGLGVSNDFINDMCTALTDKLRIGIKITGGGFGGHLLLVHDASVTEADILSIMPAECTLHYKIRI